MDSQKVSKTADEFETAYARASGVTVAQLHTWGLYAERCDCGERYCTGWAMGHQWEDAIIEDQLRNGARPNREGKPWKANTP